MAAAVIAVATRAGLVARREAIEIVHGLGATDGYIAARFAGRATLLAGDRWACRRGARLAGAAGAREPRRAVRRQCSGGDVAGRCAVGVLPAALWLVLPGMPVAAAAIGFVTAQATVRRWLRRLP